MKRILIGCILGVIATTAQSENWFSLGRSDHYETFIEPTTITTKYGITRFWIKDEFYQPVSVQGSTKKYIRTMTLWWAKCKEGTIAIKQSLAYSETGDSPFSFSIPEYKLQYDEPAPDTAKDVYFTKV